MTEPSAPSSAIPSRQWSIATRLAGAFALAASVILVLAMALLYWALSDNLDREDEQYLGDKIAILETMLKASPISLKELRDEVQRESLHRFYPPVLIRVSGNEGIIAQTNGIDSILPSAIFPPPVPFHDRRLQPAQVRDVRGRPFDVLAVTLEAGPSTYIVQVGLDQSQEDELLWRFRRSVWLVLALGLSSAALLGYVIARRGLRPIGRMSDTVRAIGSENLDRRVDPIGLPQELSSLAQTFNDMLCRLEDSFARLSQFSADIAHELRNPINNVRGLAEVAQARARAGESCADMFGPCLDECQRLSRLIDNLLFLARAEDPTRRIQREPVLISRELEAVREFYEAAADEAGVRLEMSAPTELTAELDRTLFQRAIGNLFDNALAHTPTGGRINLSAEIRDQNLRVEVSDTGCGIPPEHLPRIFDRFHRVDASRSKHTGGVGLGLAIVKSIAQLHEGHVEATSEPGRGTSIILILPVQVTGDGEKSSKDDTRVMTALPHALSS